MQDFPAERAACRLCGVFVPTRESTGRSEIDPYNFFNHKT